MKIGKFDFNTELRTFIIAELSANHNQDYDTAVKTIIAAAKAGADAIKLQTYTADTITLDCDNEYFQINHGTLWDGMTMHKLYEKAYTPWEWQPRLKRIANENGLILFSAPFDITAVDFLEEMNVPAYKIASPEILDIPLIKYVASKGKPIIISTGIATHDDIALALETCRAEGNNQIALLKCTSFYPAPIEEANLRTIPDLAQKYDVTSGLSDHTMGDTAAIAAVALGARIVEKHIILNRNIGGPDAAFSMQANEFASMVKRIRDVEAALGKITYSLTEKVSMSRKFARSLFITKDIAKGNVITTENMRSIRPGMGLHPKYFNEVLGKKISIDVKKGTPLSWDLIAK